MKRFSRALVMLSVAAALGAALPASAGDEPRETKSSEPPRYENPIVSLLFLPVTVLLKIAEVVSPDVKPSGGSDAKSGE